jgi:hypothetical protein
LDFECRPEDTHHASEDILATPVFDTDHPWDDEHVEGESVNGWA